MSKATEESLTASRKKRQEKSAELAKTRIRGKGVTSKLYHKSSLKKRSDYGLNTYSD